MTERREPNPFQELLDDATRQEAEELAATEAVIRDVLERLRATLGTQRYNAAAAFWNALAAHLERMKAEIESERDAFKPLLNDLADELERLAGLKERIFSIRRSKKETPDGPLH